MDFMHFTVDMNLSLIKSVNIKLKPIAISSQPVKPVNMGKTAHVQGLSALSGDPWQGLILKFYINSMLNKGTQIPDDPYKCHLFHTPSGYAK